MSKTDVLPWLDPEVHRFQESIPSLKKTFVELQAIAPDEVGQNTTIGIDVSRYNELDYSILNENGIKFIVAKVSQGDYRIDPLFETHNTGTIEQGMIPGGYHWDDPIEDSDTQADWFLQAIDGKTLDFIWLDMEQFWANWGEWAAWIAGQGTITQFIPPIRISESAYTIATRVRDTTRIPVGIYTRVSFVLDYARPALDWLHEFPLALAQYPYAAGRVETTWNDWIKFYYPKTLPRLMPGTDDWHFWQCSGDKFILPGCITPLDIDLFNGPLDTFQSWIHGGRVQPETWSLAVDRFLRGIGYDGPYPNE